MPNLRFTTTLGPIISAAGALLIVIGAMQPWQRTLAVATNGSEIDKGFFCLLLGVGALVFCFGRAFAQLPRKHYLLGNLVLGGIALGLSAWFLYNIKHAPSGQFMGFQFQISTPSSGIYLSLAGAILLVAATLVQTVMPDREFRGALGPSRSINPDEDPDAVERRKGAIASVDN